MPQDYKNKARRKKTNSLPNWMWLIMGLSIGVFGSFVVNLYDNKSPAFEKNKEVATATSTQIPTTFSAAQLLPTKTAPTATKPKPDNAEFDFYTLLPEMEVKVASPTLVKKTKRKSVPPVLDSHSEDKVKPKLRKKQLAQTVAKAPKKKVKRKTKSGYAIQAGAFRKHLQADRLKARLALMGIEARIQTVNSSRGTIHRVRVGPFQNRQRMRAVRSKLKAKKIDVMVLKLSG